MSQERINFANLRYVVLVRLFVLLCFLVGAVRAVIKHA